jgi:uncharacterized protein YfaQ (DUF2300 family)
MRSALVATLMLAVAAPALASDVPSKSTVEMQDMAEKLNDPAAQKAMTGALDAMLAALLDIKVDGIAKALEPLNGGKKFKMKGETLGEIAANDDRNFDKKLHQGTRAMVGGAGALAGALAKAMPELEKAMDEMEKAMDKVGDKLPDVR